MRPQFRVLDLFSGIGGFSLGLELTGGFTTYGFVEINPFCRRVLQKHWPAVPIYHDIRQVSIPRNEFDVLCGGFPCQDISVADRFGGKSILGDRSGLWFEFYRLITEGLPSWVIIENVKNLRTKGLAIILQQLAELGYAVEWHLIPAYAVGFPHVRERLWMVAHLERERPQRGSALPLQGLRAVPWSENGRRAANWLNGWDYSTPPLCRSRHGLPNYVDRITALGNAVIPAIAKAIGEAILLAESV